MGPQCQIRSTFTDGSILEKQKQHFACNASYAIRLDLMLWRVVTLWGSVQMGGPEGVRASEQYTLVIGLANGMSMHAVPRPGVMDGPGANGYHSC